MSSKHAMVERIWFRWLQSYDGQTFLAKMAKKDNNSATTPTAKTAATSPDKKKS